VLAGQAERLALIRQARAVEKKAATADQVATAKVVMKA
jgi:hypothetical protein